MECAVMRDELATFDADSYRIASISAGVTTAVALIICTLSHHGFT
jgi:hypothetical protein